MNDLLFDFAVDKDTNTITLTREFAADLDLVWDAFTKAAILDQWYAPKPFRLETKEMNFTEGGRWLYAMVSPEDARHWSLVEFIKIEPKIVFHAKNSFSDENGGPGNKGYTFSLNTTSFTAGAAKTTVQIVKKMASLAELEMFAKSGFKEGMSMTMTYLDELLASLSQKK